MNTNEITTREKLKKYFETGKYPSESQFAELIDSLRLKDDVLTKKEIAMLANNLTGIDNAYIQYSINNSIKDKFSLLINQQDAEDQIVDMYSDYASISDKKQYLLGGAPYNIKMKEFPIEGLKDFEYYNVEYQIKENFSTKRLFGNDLNTFPVGFEFGKLEMKRFLLRINRQNFGQKINILHTAFDFINKTDISIEYRMETIYWNHPYTVENVITDHYDIHDYFYVYYKADLTGINKSIECKVYDADTNDLLMTGYLNAGQNNQDAWGGGQTAGVRNIRIECNYRD